MKAYAYIQLPKPSEKPLHVDVSIAESDLMLFDQDGVMVFEMQKPEIMHANAHGMMLKGYQSDGFSRSGVPKYLYQEVFLSWIDPETKKSYFEENENGKK